MIHRISLRSGSPFVHIDLGSIPEQLFESELFGYEKGAFTDARKSKAGRFEVANGGTLFLDEIGNLTPSAQAKLLSVLQQRQICRLGSTRNIPIDVRLICATNADIASMVEEGKFRQDLFYRINTVEINVPPLLQEIVKKDNVKMPGRCKMPVHGVKMECIFSRKCYFCINQQGDLWKLSVCRGQRQDYISWRPRS